MTVLSAQVFSMDLVKSTIKTGHGGMSGRVNAIDVATDNPDVMFVGKAEGNPRNSLNGGFGVYKSLDGGETNSFYNERWKDYQNKMNTIKVNRFKEVKTFGFD